MIDVKAAGANVAMVGAALGWIYGNFTPSDAFDRHVADSRTGNILDLRRELATLPDGRFRDTLCETLVAELASICLDSSQHPFCVDRLMIIEDAGC